ncbi:FtsX-like permease family protein [Actinomadura rupiterrae]|uniref:FtsX-like permease family protein n=1 Tax=Actinomadura rupiterrae TaxID=559627 RepID=UPI0020A5D94D|nr:ABC transporter permease [Actinomadura rupiterrae]MCP2343017.1 putative ABC transport system permease protein [Actinomadura rupiterrae]
MSWSTFRERWTLFAGALLTVVVGVALVQASMMVMIGSQHPRIPAGTSPRAAAEMRDAYEGAGSLLGMTAMLACFLAVFIVGSTFAFTVAQRRADLALLRTLGGSRPQVVTLLLSEAVILGALGSAGGIVLGVPLMWIQTLLLTSTKIVPGSFEPVWDNGVLIGSVCAGIGMALAGSFAATLRASRVRPLEALRDIGRASRVMTPGRWIWGVSMLALTAAMVSVEGKVDFLGAMMIGLGVSFCGAIGLSSLSPLVVPLAGHLLRPFTRFGPLAELAQANLRDGKRRAAATAAPMIVLTALVVGLTAMLGTQAKAGGAQVERNIIGQYVVTSTGADAGRIASVPGVGATSTNLAADITLTYVRSDADERGRRQTVRSGIYAIDAADWARTHKQRPVSGTLEAVHGKGVLAGPGSAEDGVRRGAKAVAEIGGKKVKLEVAARLPGTVENNADAFYIPRTLLPPDMAAKAEAETIVQVAPGASAADVAQRLRDLRIGKVQTVAKWSGARVAKQQEQNDSVMMVLLGLSAAYAVVAVINAMIIAGTERRREFAVARLTGLSRRQVVRSALLEAAGVALIGVGLGLLVALAALGGFLFGPSGAAVLAVPWTLIALLVLGAFAISGVTSVLTTRAATRVPPVALAAARE